MARRARIAMVVVPLLAAGALGLAVASIARSNSPPAPAAKQPQRATANVVAGSGVVEPAGREVAVATGVPGVVRDVRVKPGDAVQTGDVLFVVDDAVASAILEQRRQDLAAAERRLEQTIARLPQLAAEAAAARSALEAAEADRDEAADQVRTATPLLGSALSQRELSRRRNLLRSAESRVAEAQARLDGALATMRLSDPDQKGAAYLADQQAVTQAQSALALAQTEHDRLTIRSPRAGTILAVNVRAGEFAAQGSQTVPVILGALSPLHVRVDVDEADLPRLQLGAPATAARRGASEDRIPLAFVRAEPLVTAKRSLTGGSDERVDTRVLQLIYQVGATAIDLRPGQLLDVTVQPGGQVPPARQ
ncbi:MAG: HlyD family efflux transporter periplasmic adaptor subunit [Alphaproteobacteria bacterium]|nr:HlyD family efflux transporter periplasmic adaptor subunit [Alphaproteobacteria bacterium]